MLIKCAFDDDGCIDLASVMRIISQIDQEQAWALAYQLAALMQRLWPAGNDCATIENLAQIYINQEGLIHEKSLRVASVRGANHRRRQSRSEDPATTESSSSESTPLPPTPPITPELDKQSQQQQQQQQRQRATSEQELVSSLGIALFQALDYGIPDDEERKLSRTMELLIVESQKGLTLAELQDICIQRLPTPTKVAAEQHYREACKALIADTIELSLLLDKIYTATMVMNGAESASLLAAPHNLQPSSETNNNNNTSDMMSHHQATNYLHLGERHTTQADYLHQHLLHTIDQDELKELGLPLASLRALKINEWARLWMQVIRELRQKRRFQQHQQRHQYENEQHAPNDVLQAV